MGATGNQGGTVVRHLLPKGHRIRTFTRNVDSAKAKQLKEMGVEVVEGDFTDPGSLAQAILRNGHSVCHDYAVRGRALRKSKKNRKARLPLRGTRA